MGYALKVKNEHGDWIKVPLISNSEVDVHEAGRVDAEQDRVSAENSRVEAENVRAVAEEARVVAEEERVVAEEKRAEAEAERVAFWSDKSAVYVGTGEMPDGCAVQIDPSGEGGLYDEDIEKIVNMVLARTGLSARIGNVTLVANNWVGESSPYSQVVTIEGVTEKSQVDLTPSVEHLSIFHHKDLAFVTENDGGVVTVYAIGQKPENDYTIQVTITEVIV